MSEDKKIVVKIKNLFESFAPKKKIFAEGFYEINNDFIKNRYGITLQNLGSYEDKNYFFERLLKSFDL